MFRKSKYPVFDIIYLENLPKSAALPVATLNEAKLRLIQNAPTSIFPSKVWDFDYIYFTESDQVRRITCSINIFSKIYNKYRDSNRL
jgi:hypothetical protein